MSVSACVVLLQFPEDLAEHAEPRFGIRRRQAETSNEAAEFEFAGGRGALLNVAGMMESFQKKSGKALAVINRDGPGGHKSMRRGSGVTAQFVEANRNGLAKVHRAVLFARRNAQQPMAVAHLIVRKSEFFRTKEESDRRFSQPLTYQLGRRLQAIERCVKIAVTNRGGSGDERSTRNRIRHRLTDLSLLEDIA